MQAFSRHVSIVTAFLAVVVPSTAVAESSYTLTISGIVVGNGSVQTTDGGQAIAAGKKSALTVGDALEPGDTVLIYYPGVAIHLDDGAGTRLVLECNDCTRDAPLELVIGNPGVEKPFKQQRGRVHYKIATEKSWFEVMFDVLQGPEEELIPIGVEGTHFMLESFSDGFTVTVAEGRVQTGVPGNETSGDLDAGQQLSRIDGKLATGEADAATLRLMQQALKLPAAFISTTASTTSTSSTLAWTTVGVGALVTGAGAVLHILANEANLEIQAEANGLCNSGGLGAGAGPQADAQDYYDREFDDRVKPKRTASYVLYGVGGATLAAGIIWLLVDSSKSVAADNKSVPVNVVPAFGDGGARMMLQWEF